MVASHVKGALGQEEVPLGQALGCLGDGRALGSRVGFCWEMAGFVRLSSGFLQGLLRVFSFCVCLFFLFWGSSSGFPYGHKKKRLVCWLGGWVAGWLPGWLASWLLGWLVGWLFGWLLGLARSCCSPPHFPFSRFSIGRLLCIPRWVRMFCFFKSSFKTTPKRQTQITIATYSSKRCLSKLSSRFAWFSPLFSNNPSKHKELVFEGGSIEVVFRGVPFRLHVGRSFMGAHPRRILAQDAIAETPIPAFPAAWLRFLLVFHQPAPRFFPYSVIPSDRHRLGV